MQERDEYKALDGVEGCLGMNSCDQPQYLSDMILFHRKCCKVMSIRYMQSYLFKLQLQKLRK